MELLLQANCITTQIFILESQQENIQILHLQTTPLDFR